MISQKTMKGSYLGIDSNPSGETLNTFIFNHLHSVFPSVGSSFRSFCGANLWFMDTQITVKRGSRPPAMCIAALCLFAIATPLAAAEEPSHQLELSFDSRAESTSAFKYKEVKLGGFERKKLSKGFKVRGWEVARKVYLGQAKIAKKWGFGVVVERGNTVYGMNHRGIQVLKRF